MKGNRMKTANLVVVLDKENKSVLLCKRRKNPYKGLLNFVGGKLEPDEDSAAAAYRELREETGITDHDISLTHLMDLTYFTWDLKLEVFFGWLNKSVSLKEEVNELLWVDKEQNYFDMSHFAGEGNMGHIMEQIKQYEEEQAFPIREKTCPFFIYASVGK